MADGPPGSPYEIALGDSLDGLPPRLRAYFGAIPGGRHGYGAGTFSRIGTPRRWLWPVLWLLGRDGVLFPGWERDVPFTVINRAALTRDGRVAVTAVRTFHFASGSRRMVDAITAEPHGLVDYLGRHRLLEASLAGRVVDGALSLESTRVHVRLGRRRLRIPAAWAPRVSLTERFDAASHRQHVAVDVSVPGIGRVYEYTGSFGYEIRPGETSA